MVKMNLIAKAEKMQSGGVVLFAAEEKNKSEIFPAELAGISSTVDLASFKGKGGETIYLSPAAEPGCIIAGLGSALKITPETLRRAAASAVRSAIQHELHDLTVIIPETPGLDENTRLRAAAEGIMLGNYSFDRYKREKKKLVGEVTFLSTAPDGKRILKETQIVCGNTLLCRDLVNGTSDEVNPSAIAALAKKTAKGASLRCDVLQGSKIDKLGMGLFSAVARGSSYGPYLIILSYKGNPKSKETTAIVGKGITFDSGGYNLKPTGHIEEMRSDMAGAAAALFTIKSASELDMKKNITVFIPVCENLIGSRAYKPGDIFTAFDGTTVEILSTDAEGRLILADTISYAVAKHKPSRIIELSTLTGACITALGELYAGLMSRNEPLRTAIEESAASTGERLWALPLDEDYDKDLDSEFADLRNINPERQAGTIAGGAFLNHFAKETPFAHIDIAGTSWLSKERGVNPKHATGYGVRLLTETLRRL